MALVQCGSNRPEVPFPTPRLMLLWRGQSWLCFRLPRSRTTAECELLFPLRYTIGSIGGETDADTRGWLETVVRVHGFGEFAQAHAGGGGGWAGLCAQSPGGCRGLGAVGAAARVRVTAPAQSGARPPS